MPSLRGSHFTLVVEATQHLPQGVLFCVTEDLPWVSLGQASWGKVFYPVPGTPTSHVESLAQGSLGPGARYH